MTSFALPRRSWLTEEQEQCFETAYKLIENYRAFGADSRIDGQKTHLRQAHLSSLLRDRQDGAGFLAAVQKAIAGFRAEDTDADKSIHRRS